MDVSLLGYSMKEKYMNDETQVMESFDYPVGAMMFPALISWLLGKLVLYFQT